MTGSFLKKNTKKLFASKRGISRSESPIVAREHSFPNLVLNSILKFIFFWDAKKILPLHILSSISLLVHCVWTTDFFVLRNLRTSTLGSCQRITIIVIYWALRRCQALLCLSRLLSPHRNLPNTTPKFVLAPN